MSPVRLEKCVPEKNQQRFYLLRLAPTLFGEWSLIREWGRIGQQGRVILDTFATTDEVDRRLYLRPVRPSALPAFPFTGQHAGAMQWWCDPG